MTAKRLKHPTDEASPEDRVPGAEPVRYWLDRSGKLARLAKTIIAREYPDLADAKFLFTWRKPPAYDGDRLIRARARKLPVKWRDVLGCDFEIEVARTVWRTMSPRQRYRLLWHELKHCLVRRDEAGVPLRDAVGRLRLGMLPHDLVIGTFKDEVRRWGVPPDYAYVAELLVRRSRTAP